jgi:CheY-like chemotaxis protein
MVTAYGREEVLKGAETVGIEEVLIKPVNPSQLFDAAMRAFGAQMEDAPDNQRDPATTGTLDLANLKGLKVLLAEDNDFNQQVATELLSDGGVVVDIAENGAIAVAKVKSGAYDLVLMDMQMPVMDGITATEEIRKLGLNLPIIAMTANAMEADKVKCLEAGMNDHLAKPIDPDDLFAALLKWRPPPSGVKGETPAAAATKPEPDAAHPLLAELDPDVFDLERLGPVYKWDMARLRPMLAGFLADTRAKLAVIDGQPDLDALRQVAHGLKGTANTAGATRLGRLAGDVEDAARSGNADAVSMLVPLLAPTLAELEAALSTLLDPTGVS